MPSSFKTFAHPLMVKYDADTFGGLFDDLKTTVSGSLSQLLTNTANSLVSKPEVQQALATGGAQATADALAAKLNAAQTQLALQKSKASAFIEENKTLLMVGSGLAVGLAVFLMMRKKK